MSTFERQIDNVRRYFDEHKAERCPFENVALKEKDEYIKSLYFRMLCTLIRYTGEPNEMQVLYVRRLIAGSDAENEFSDYMKMALDLDTSDVDEFISVMSEDILRYYFCIDGAILLSVVKQDKNFELLAELVEMLGISKNELNYLIAAARAVCMQNSDMFDEAKTLSTDATKKLDLFHYVQGFYSGDIVNTPSLLHIYSRSQAKVDLSAYPTFTAQKVIIENISAFIDDDIVFEGCSEVIIRGCKFTGKTNRFCFYRVGKVTIENCEIDNFSNRFAMFDNVNEFALLNNIIMECGYTKDSDICGGVLYSSGNTHNIILKNNKLQRCYIDCGTCSFSSQCTAIFLYHAAYGVETISVINNSFNGCEYRNMNRFSSYIGTYIRCNATERINEGNKFTGSVTRLFEEECLL